MLFDFTEDEKNLMFQVLQRLALHRMGNQCRFIGCFSNEELETINDLIAKFKASVREVTA